MFCKRFFKTLFFVCTLYFYAASVNAQNANQKDAGTSKLNPWFTELNIAFSNGLSYARIGEFVYKNFDKRLLSRLDWDKIALWKAGVHVNCDIKRWRIFLDTETAVPVLHTGFMQDKDWKNESGELTNLSEHTIRMDAHFSAQASFAFRIWDLKYFSAGAGAGFEYIKTEVTGSDGTRLQPLPVMQLSGDFISYKQELYVPWLTFFAEWKPRPVFETSVFVQCAPVAFAEALDTHYSYNTNTGLSSKPEIDKQFMDRMHGYAAVKGELTFRCNFAGKKSVMQGDIPLVRHSAELRLNAVFVPELQGKTYSRTSAEYSFSRAENGLAGSSFRSLGLSLAYCIRIR